MRPRQTGMREKRVALVVAILFLLGACGEPSGSVGASPDDPVTSTPSPSAPGGGDKGAQRVEPRSGLVDVSARPFEKAKVLDGGNAVDIFFYSGIEDCYGLDHVEVGYRHKSVVVTLYEGRVPEAEVCIEIAVEKVTRVELDEPLGDRRIVDGAK
jgi:hypothetical protein